MKQTRIDSAAGATAEYAGEFDHPDVTLIGLLFETAAGAAESLEDGFHDAGRLSGQLFEPLIRLARTDGERLRMSDLAAQCHYNVSTLARGWPIALCAWVSPNGRPAPRIVGRRTWR